MHLERRFGVRGAPSKARLGASLVALVWVGASCAGDDTTGPDPDRPASISATSGSDQTGAPGETLPDPLLVTVENSAGEPVSGASVEWSTPDGGVLVPAASTTDATGMASASWTLADLEGEQSATATVQDLAPVTFTATAEPLPVAAVVIDEPPGPLTWLGESSSLSARVLDESGDELKGYAIEWSSLDADVATVSGAGVVRARGDGTARLVATVLSVADTTRVSVTFDRPAWRFSVLAGVTPQTSEHYGGLASVSELIRTQMDTVTVRFNRPRVIAGFLEFTVDSIYVFDGSVDTELCAGHPDQDFRVVYDGFPTHGGGWYGGCTAIHHSWSVETLGGPFGASATDGIVHEFGHARGAIDLYALEVSSGGNPVNGVGYEALTSVMNYPYGELVWDAHSVHLFDANQDVVSPPITYITAAFPPSVGVRVEDAAGASVEGAEVELYPVEWFGGTVASTPLRTASTDVSGEAVFDPNPFGPGDASAPWNISVPNFLVVVRAQGAEAHAWMPLTAVQNAYFERPSEPFRLVVSF